MFALIYWLAISAVLGFVLCLFGFVLNRCCYFVLSCLFLVLFASMFVDVLVWVLIY